MDLNLLSSGPPSFTQLQRAQHASFRTSRLFWGAKQATKGGISLLRIIASTCSLSRESNTVIKLPISYRNVSNNPARFFLQTLVIASHYSGQC